MTPKVSVVIPTYNAPNLLCETLESVFEQTFGDFEVIVVNDGSSDNTLERLQEFSADSRLRVISQANGGIGAARNRGIADARGEYIALLDHDDLWAPAKLATQVAYLDVNRDCIVCSVPWGVSAHPLQPMCDLSALCNERGVVDRTLHALAKGHLFLI